MSGCCFNQVESGPGTDLQLVERPVIHMGFIMGLGENQSGTIVFPLLQLNWNSFLCLCLTHTERTMIDSNLSALYTKKKKILKLSVSCLNTRHRLESV